jgi:putative peptide zinc metalloprotease protein
MSAATLKLRSDLVFSPQGGPEKRSYVIKNPAAGRFFHMGELECFIARQLDGTTSLAEVQRRVEEKFGSAISAATLERFTEWLRQRGLLADERTLAMTAPISGRRIGGNIFYVRFRAFDPDRFLSWLAGRLEFLFTPAFVASSGALILFALGLTVLNWPEIQREFLNLFHLESLLLAWLAMLAVITLHEFAHGLTCKHFGGQVHELGFLLLYFQPAFYCNVSDAWLFPEKSKRMWVTFAGAYFEMFLWAVSTVVWRLTDFDTTVNHLALVVTATSAIRSLFNMNPLIKLDGYYLLSDWLAIPNLRQKAFEYLKTRPAVWRNVVLLRSAATGRRFFTTQNAAPGQSADRSARATLAPRERRVFLVYGLLAGAYTFWILEWILSSLGNYLVTRYEAWGFGAFSFLLLGIFRQPIRRSFARLRVADTNGETKAHYHFPKKWVKAIALVAVTATALHFWPMELRVAGDFIILPVRNADVRAEVEGFIVDIPHDEGELVQRGDVIAHLNDRDVRAELDKLAAEIDRDTARLKMLKAGARPEEIAEMKAEAAQAGEQVNHAANMLARDKMLFDIQLLSPQEYDTSKSKLAQQQDNFTAVKSKLALLLAGARPEEIAAMEAEVNRLKAQQVYLQGQLKLLTVTSPVTGIIATHRIREELGQHVQKGDLIAAVDELNTVVAEIAVSEKDISAVKVGQKVTLKARALPQTRFAGTVTGIAPVATPPAEKENPQAPRTVLVMTQLENPSLQLHPEMSGRAKIDCGGQNALQLLLRRFVRYFRVEFWSWW